MSGTTDIRGVKELMPYAKAVSAKSHHFDDDGNEVSTDYFQMMKIVLDAGYRGYVGIEFEGGGDEYAGFMPPRSCWRDARINLPIWPGRHRRVDDAGCRG